MEAGAAEQLLHVHRAVEKWQRCKGDLEQGTRALKEAACVLRTCLDVWVSDDGDGDKQLLALACQELAQAQYLHALALCAAGHGPAADPWVAGLGFRLRLSDQVWAACGASLAGHKASPAAAVPGTATSSDRTPATASLLPPTIPASPPAASAVAAPHSAAALDARITATALPASSPSVAAHVSRQAASEASHSAPLGTLGEGPHPVTTRREPLQQRSPPAGTCGGPTPPTAPPQLRTPLVYDGALTEPLLERLAAAFDPYGGTPYWRQHRYGKRSTPFFSYLYRLDHPPSSVVEEAIQHLHRRLLEQADVAMAAAPVAAAATAAPAAAGDATTPAREEAPRLHATCSAVLPVTAVLGLETVTEGNDYDGGGATCCSHGGSGGGSALRRQHAAALAAALRGACVAEWWAHTRDPAAPHQLHFDVDEGVLRRGLGCYRLSHPRLGSVVFLPPAAPAARAAATAAAAAAAAEAAAAEAAAAEEVEACETSEPAVALGGVTACCPGGPTLVLEQTPAGGCMDEEWFRSAGSCNPDKGEEAHNDCVGALAPVPPPSRPPLARRAWPVAPRPNRLLLFPGDLLHGVMPQPPGQQQLQSPQPLPVPASKAAPETAAATAADGAIASPLRQQQQDEGQQQQHQQQDGPSRTAGSTDAQLRRTTLIVAWWGPERLQTAAPAPPLELSAVGGGDEEEEDEEEEATDEDEEDEESSSGSDESSSEGIDRAESGSEDTSSSTSDSGGIGTFDSMPFGQASLHMQSRRVRLYWRHTAPLRPGMVLASPLPPPPHLQPPPAPPSPPPLPLQAAPALPVAAKESRPLPQPRDATAGYGNGASGIEASETDGTEPDVKRRRKAYGANVGGGGDGIATEDATAPPPPPPPPSAAPPTWLEWFAELTRPSMPATAAAADTKTAALQAAAGAVAAWHEPSCVTPAWMPIRPPPVLLGAASTLVPPMACAQAAGETEAAAVWDLARQAARGMAVALGLGPPHQPSSPRLRSPSSGGCQNSGTAAPAPWKAAHGAGRPGSSVTEGDVACAGASAHRDVGMLAVGPVQDSDTDANASASASVNALGDRNGGVGEAPAAEEEGAVVARAEGHATGATGATAAVEAAVMHALRLPDLRVFLRHPLDLTRLYLPEAAAGAASNA